MSPFAVVAIAVGAVGLVAAGAWLWRRSRGPKIARAAIVSEPGSNELAPSGALRSVQAAELALPREALDAIWTPMHLERLARTYWRFITRVTLGLIRVEYTPGERFLVFISRPATLMRFGAPEYEMDARRGIVRWRIEGGLLVSRRGRGGVGHLQIDVLRREDANDATARMRVEVEVSNYYPAIATGISTRLYKLTQSWVHVVVTHGFLRSLARLDLAESKVGRFARTSGVSGRLEDVPDPPPLNGPRRPRARS